VQMESFFSAAAPRRGGLPAGTPGRDKSRGDFALCLEKACLSYFSPPAVIPPVRQEECFYDVYREQGGVPLRQGPSPEKSGGERYAQTGCEEPGFLSPQSKKMLLEMTPDEHGDEQGGERQLCPELLSTESDPLQGGQLSGEEGILQALLEGKEPAGPWQEEALLQLEIDAAGAAVKGLSSLGQGLENSAERLFFTEAQQDTVPEYKSPTELFLIPEGDLPANGPDSLQLQHDAEFFSLMSGEKLQEESAAEILPPRQENQAGAEEFVLAVAEETGESEISSFLARLGSSPGNEPAGEKGAAGGAVTGQNPGVGEQEPVGEVHAEAFSTGEVEDQVFASIQNFGRTVENLNTPGNFRPAAEISVPADFSGEIIFQIVEQAGHLAMSGAQELRLRLQPEFLGEVLIRIRRLQGVLSAEIITPHLAVKELLEGQLETLRQRFQEANLNVEHLDVLIQDEGKSGFTLAGDDGNQDSPGAFKAQGARENVVAGENRDLSSGLRGEGGRVDCLV
jgi:hypothetical protein